MINSRLKELLIHPAFIALILTVILILFIPPVFSRYMVKHIMDEDTNLNTVFIYSDLDSDGNSERISFDLNDREQTKIIISSDNKILDQYNLKYQPGKNSLAFIDDYDHDDLREIYVFTMNRDSIFLNIIDPFKSKNIILAGRFIDLWNKAESSDDIPQVNPVGMTAPEPGHPGYFIFFINSGYSLQPRNVYRYSVAEDSLIKSPQNGAVIHACNLSDIDNDSQPEILLDVGATGNSDEAFPFSDQYSWLMVLDRNLKFLFPPIRFSEDPSNLKVLPYKQQNRKRLLVFNSYFGSEDYRSAFYLYDLNGNKLIEKPVEGHDRIFASIYANCDSGTQTFFFLKNRETEIEEMDSTFKSINSLRIPPIEFDVPIAEFDADGDGKKEYIFQGRGNRSIVIVQNNFKYPLSFKFENYSPVSPILTQVLKSGEKPQVYLQFPDRGTYIQFLNNQFYYLKYPFYAFIYLSALAFIILISRIQQYRLSQKHATEKRIAALQMKAIKNQIDPHFTLNMLNAIGSLYATEKDREKADYIFGKYARLIRQTVVSSDQIIVTLGEELDFVKNYIELEQFRCENPFDYTINIDEGIDKQIKIPRMLLHTFVENAIKYGARNRAKEVLLKIDIRKTGNKCRIVVEDNGPGLHSDKKFSSGTGRGLVILNELIELYFKLEKSRITYSLQDISGPGNRVDGTRAVIELSC